MDHIPRTYYATVEKLRKEIILLIISEATQSSRENTFGRRGTVISSLKIK